MTTLHTQVVLAEQRLLWKRFDQSNHFCAALGFSPHFALRAEPLQTSVCLYLQPQLTEGNTQGFPSAHSSGAASVRRLAQSGDSQALQPSGHLLLGSSLIWELGSKAQTMLAYNHAAFLFP